MSLSLFMTSDDLFNGFANPETLRKALSSLTVLQSKSMNPIMECPLVS